MAPYCYVKPTTNMRIRISATVDTSGRIYLPYLSTWQYPSYDTAGLLQVHRQQTNVDRYSKDTYFIQVMIITFQDKCPVYSVGPSVSTNTHSNTSSNSSPTSMYPTNPTPIPPPYPINGNPNPPYPSASANPPPYPTADPPPHLMPQPNAVRSSGLCF
jgi:ESCRT-I complex subunit TSG101